MRKQYFFRPSERGLLAWDVDRLVRLSSALPVQRVPLSRIRELEGLWTGDAERPSWTEFIQHVALVQAADLAHPIILSATGDVMDGMHRVAKSVLEGRSHIDAVQFATDPEPDHVGRGPDDLPYDAAV